MGYRVPGHSHSVFPSALMANDSYASNNTTPGKELLWLVQECSIVRIWGENSSDMHGKKSENMVFFPRYIWGYYRSFLFKGKHSHKSRNRNLLLNISVKTCTCVDFISIYACGHAYVFLFFFSVSIKMVWTFSLQLVLAAYTKPGSSSNNWQIIDPWHCWRHICLTGSPQRLTCSQNIRGFCGTVESRMKEQQKKAWQKKVSVCCCSELWVTYPSQRWKTCLH